MTITDNRFCTESFDVTITEPVQLFQELNQMLFMEMIQPELSLIIFLVMACQMEPGLLIWEEEHPPYNYNWSTGGNNQLENNIGFGTHSVTVTDVNNCSETMTVTLVEPDALVVNGSSSGDFNLFPGGFDISCKGLNDGECL